jgi:hypothetical protein
VDLAHGPGETGGSTAATGAVVEVGVDVDESSVGSAGVVAAGSGSAVGSGVGCGVGDGGAVGPGDGAVGVEDGAGADGPLVGVAVAIDEVGGTTAPGPAGREPAAVDAGAGTVPVEAAGLGDVGWLSAERDCTDPVSDLTLVVSGSTFADATSGCSASAMGASALAPGNVVVEGLTVPAARLYTSPLM